MTRKAEAILYASQWQLMWRKFRSHKLAVVSLGFLAVLYLLVAFAQFVAPYDPRERHSERINAPPQRIRVWENGRFQWPFVYAYQQELDENTLAWVYSEDRSHRFALRFFVHSYRYRLLGVAYTDMHFVRVDEPGTLHLLGTDSLGRDVFSRLIIGGQISLSIGLVGIALSFVIGSLLGGLSGYYGGTVDMIIQRLIEFLVSLPTLPLWMGLAAAVPVTWPTTRIYFMMTVILSLVSWTGLARVVRGKILSVREEDYVMAARLSGAGQWWILRRHLLPSLFSYMLVSLTMAIPGMILGETALSFLGLGLQPPAISWGVLLQGAQNVRSIALYPWLLSPAVAIVVTVLCFNFVGDGLRDAVDPYVR
ncbi:MAG: ABC transporter permease [Firmicutes bacterium]|nr:ABC transporter permease [Bacillota bacterium]